MKKLLTGSLVSLVAFATGFGATFGNKAIKYKQNIKTVAPKETTTIVEESEEDKTPARKLLKNIMELQTFNVNGDIRISTENNFFVNFGLDVDGDISNFEKIKVKGDLNLNLDGIPLNTNIAYIDNTIYFALGNSRFSLETDNLFDFVKFLPTIGLNIELPEQLTNLDLNTITEEITNMEYVVTPNGDYFFEANILGLELKILTDEEYSFKGIRMNETNFNGTLISLDLATKELPIDEVDLTSPVAEGITYKKFEPAFNIFKSLYSTFSQKKNTIGLEVSVAKGEEPLISTDLDFSYDIENMLFGLNGKIKENTRSHEFDAFFQDKTVYFGYNDLKVSIQLDTIISSISFILDTLNVDLTEKLLNAVVKMLEDDDFKEKLSGIGDLVKDFTLEDEFFEIELDTNAIGLNLGTIKPTIEFKEGMLSSISFNEIDLLGIKVNVKLVEKTYIGKKLVEEDYEVIEPVFTLIEGILPLLEETQFAVELDGVIGDGDDSTKDVIIDGGLQFDIENNFGYGDITITDKKEYKHVIKGDMENPDEFYFSYNNKTNGKFTSKTIYEVINLALDVILNPDEHFLELFGDIIEKIMAMPLYMALTGDVGVLLETNIINDMKIEDEKMTINIDLAMVNMDANLDVVLNYHQDKETREPIFDGLSIKNLNLNGTTVEFNARIKKYNVAKEKARLDVTDKTKFLDFSDIKVLLELGINTSKFNYFHFAANLNLNLKIFGFDIQLENIPIDIKIRNVNGHVQVAAEFDKIPVINILGLIDVNTNKDYNHTYSRTASLYYDDGTIYTKRVDEVDDKKLLFFGDYYEVTYSRKMDSDYFFANIANVLLVDILGLSQENVENILSNGDTSKTGTQIKYEEILKGFNYDDSYAEGKGRFKFTVNLNALLNLSIFNVIDLYVITDTVTNELTSIETKLTILSIISAAVSIETLEKDQLNDSNKLTVLDSWAASRLEDTMNELYTIEVKK